MTAVMVTGAAGFIGSHLTERLIRDGYAVTALDACRGDPGAVRARRRLQAVWDHPAFRWVPADVLDADLGALLPGVEAVFHLAGRPGVRESWGAEFPGYARDNLLATQRLAEAAVAAGRPRIIFASTSSVYGTAPMPFVEQGPVLPVSPYGVTKHAAENCLGAYARSFGLPVVVLRYFTVYGPRQRPDMAFSKWFRAVSRGETVTLYGRDSRRDFTYVGDAVDLTVRARTAPPGRTYNVASATPVAIERALGIIGGLCGTEPRIQWGSRPPGDPPATWADISAAAGDLGYQPGVSIEEGLRRQWTWLQGEGTADAGGP